MGPHASNESLPRIASPSIWHSIVPKAFRQPSDPVSLAERARLRSEKPKGWNPATFFIIISLLIGSNAIQTIALRNEFLNFSRKADAKIALLKEVIERVQKGEDVDVEGLLGTGNKEKEKEWEEGKSCALRWLFALNVILLFEWLANGIALQCFARLKQRTCFGSPSNGRKKRLKNERGAYRNRARSTESMLDRKKRASQMTSLCQKRIELSAVQRSTDKSMIAKHVRRLWEARRILRLAVYCTHTELYHPSTVAQAVCQGTQPDPLITSDHELAPRASRLRR
ncbi:hypothetical protein LTR04_001223 [Oleoguttula sp. CCFEE 6159]|nr:hypothetical protein LTR04_001223 [Oleoguttula sp. CCFEE 6159]